MRLFASLLFLLCAAPTRGQESPPAPDRVALPWRFVDLTVGDSVQLSACPMDSAGRALELATSWSIEDSTVARIDGHGTVVAAAPGKTRGHAILTGGASGVSMTERFDVAVRPRSLPAFALTDSIIVAEEASILAAVVRTECGGALLDQRLPEHPREDHGPSPRRATRRLSPQAIRALVQTGCLGGTFDPTRPTRGLHTLALSVPAHFGSNEVEIVTLSCDMACRSMVYRLVRRIEGWVVVHEEMRWIE